MNDSKYDLLIRILIGIQLQLLTIVILLAQK